MEVRLLGLVEASRDGRDVALGGAKQRALLAMLALHPNAPVSADRLMEGLWGERLPPTAPKMVQLYVSQLRKLIEGDEGEIVTRGRGYELRVAADSIDAVRFERLVGEAARAEGTSNSLAREALALWRGPPLDDVADEPFAADEIRRLEDLWLRARELAIDDALAGGQHGAVLGEIEYLVAEHPLRERLHAQRMLALYRSGRQAEALEAYRHARDVLVQEVGVEPGPELRRLHEAILRQDPGIDSPVRATPAAEAPRRAFVGRERELAELVAGLDDVFAGRGRLFLVAGEPGIGKSRLAEELMAQARARGAHVLLGRCWEEGGAPAYWPWVQSLRAYVRGTEPDALRSQLGGGAADLAQALPELRELFPDIPDVASPESQAARFRLFEAVASFLRTVARVRPLVLALDDVHVADEPSLLLLRFVARQIVDAPLMVVCAYRDVDPTLRDPLTSAVAALVREPHTGQIALGGLTEPNVADYIERATHTEPPSQLVAAIRAQTDGNPLYVVELVQLLAAEGRIDHPDTHLKIPLGVRAVIGQRVGRLSPACRSLLAAASVIGREFGLDALTQLSGLSRDDVLDVLDEALAERVLGEAPGSPGRLRFAHALIRDTLYDELTATRKLRLHRRAGEALETVYAADLEPHLAELAQHFVAAASAGAADKALEYARRAGDRAARQLAYEEATRLYGTALALCDEPTTRCELLLALGDVHARAGDSAASRQALREAAEIAERLRLSEHLARAALGYGGRILWDKTRDDEHLVPMLERALTMLGDADSALRVRLLTRVACGPHLAGSAHKAALSREALESARRIGDPATLAYALDGYIPTNESPRNTRRFLALATELLEVAGELGDKERVFDAHEHRLGRLLELGQMFAARTELDAMGKLAVELRQPAQRWLVRACEARLALMEGRFADAEELIAEALTLGEHAQSSNATVTHRLQLYMLRREQGRLAEVEDLIRRTAAQYPDKSAWRCVMANLTATLGVEAESREHLRGLAQNDFAEVVFDDSWLVSMAFVAEAVAALGDTPRAAVLYQRLLPYAHRVAVTYPEVATGSVARYLGVLAATIERWDDAERHFNDAVGMNERIGAKPWLAHSQNDYARMLFARAVPGNSERARLLASQAVTTYRQLGMRTHATMASALTLNTHPPAP